MTKLIKHKQPKGTFLISNKIELLAMEVALDVLGLKEGKHYKKTILPQIPDGSEYLIDKDAQRSRT